MTIDLTAITLDAGAHDTREQGVCLLEAAAWLAGEPHTDRPQCVSPVLTSMGQSLNDRLPAGKRQLLIPILPTLLGTRGDGLDEARGYLALDWLVRTYTPAWLDLAGLSEPAAELRGLRRIVDLAAAEAAGPVVRAGADKARTAGAAARAAAGDAAWAAAGDAAGDAARDALAPTVDQLQDSAIALYAAMARPALP